MKISEFFKSIRTSKTKQIVIAVIAVSTALLVTAVVLTVKLLKEPEETIKPENSGSISSSESSDNEGTDSSDIDSSSEPDTSSDNTSSSSSPSNGSSSGGNTSSGGSSSGTVSDNNPFPGFSLPLSFTGLDFGLSPKRSEMDANKALWGRFNAHDPAIFEDPKTGMYYAYSTDAQKGGSSKLGIQIRKSKDLVSWEYVGWALSDAAVNESKAGSSAGSFWAPDMVYTGGKYRLYYSVTKEFGSRESKIWLAESSSPTGPFNNVGVVVDSYSTRVDNVNAIDPDVIEAGGKQYMCYGSFGGGIYIIELGSNGLNSAGTKNFGTCIAKKPNGFYVDGPEGPSILYKDGYYYLFLSYGNLNSTYDTRVGRSKSITGPYTDMAGKNMVSQTAGVKLLDSYKFLTATVKSANTRWSYKGVIAPGHGTPLSTKSGTYFIHHQRDGFDTASHFLTVRKMEFVNGWPVMSPLYYAGESSESPKKDYFVGSYETIILTDNNNNQKIASNTKFTADGKVSGGISGSYTYSGGILKITTGGKTVTAKVLGGWDYENSKPTICFTGLDGSGTAYWGKKIY